MKKEMILDDTDRLLSLEAKIYQKWQVGYE